MPKINKKSKPVEQPKDIDHGVGREVKYAELDVICYALSKKIGPLTADLARQLLGWEEEPEDGKWGVDFDVRDARGKKVRLHNNLSNRPWDQSTTMVYASEILKGCWNGGVDNGPNGETIGIGRTGIVINGQHSLVALVYAEQEWTDHPEEWPVWTSAPTIDKLVVFGLAETSSLINTIDTGKKRTLADVIFRDDRYFKDLSKGERIKVAKVCEHTIRFLADRTLAFEDAYSPQQTNQTFIDFLSRHGRLLRAVQFVWDAETEGSISQIIPISTAAGLLYLMGCSGCNAEKYLASEQPDESQLTFGQWELAEKFWEWIGNRESKIRFPISSAYSAIAHNRESVSTSEKLGTVIKAWELFSVGKKIEVEKLALKYSEADGEGICHLIKDELPLVCAIDRRKEEPPVDPDDETPVEAEPVDDTVKLARKTNARAAQKSFGVGDNVWVIGDPVETSWQGEVVDLIAKTNQAKLKILKPFAGAGKTQLVPVSSLNRNKPVV